MKSLLWIVMLSAALEPNLMLFAQQENRDQRGNGRNERGNQAEPSQQVERNRQGDGGRQVERAADGGSGLGNYQKPPPANDIPAHSFDVILGRPTNQSIDVRILQNEDGQGLIKYRVNDQNEWQKSATVSVTKGKALNIKLEGLSSDTEYEYQWSFEGNDTASTTTSDTYKFRTQRSVGSSFVFSVTADSHLDENSSGAVYTQTLKNALAEQPDFHLELGDTFMTGKYAKPELSYGQYLAQRYYLSTLCSSAPLFFVMGNHDGESAGRGSFTWASTTRKSLFPNPVPDGFYTGNTQQEDEVGLPENYYAWFWGDAQFIVLDPYRYTTAKRRGGGGGQRGQEGQRGQGQRGQGQRGQLEQGKQSGSNSAAQESPNGQSIVNQAGQNEAASNWYWTLGDKQYKWLEKELTKSVKYRFVFIHHLVGGAVQNQRGGVEVAKLWEWGGHNNEGQWEFDKSRPTWKKPIHQMLIDAGVSIVFHGHDHFFAKQDLDGIVYQEVPQPSHARTGNTRNAAEYGYLLGDFQPSSGYVRVRVEADAARVDYVRTYISGQDAQRNGEVSYSYIVPPKQSKQ